MTLAHESEFEESAQIGGADATELREVVQSLFSDENLNLKTVLTAEQVVALTLAEAFADEYDVDLIRAVAAYFKRLKVSEKARGRMDMRSVLQAFLGQKNDDDVSKEFQKLLR